MSDDGQAYEAKERLIARMVENHRDYTGKDPDQKKRREFESKATQAAERCNRQYPYQGKRR